MTDSSRRSPRASALLRAAALVLSSIAASACGDDITVPPATREEVAVILNSIERSLTMVPVDSPGGAVTIGIAPDGTPVGLAVRNGTAVVPLGTVPAAAIVDLSLGTTVRTIPLPAGSGATGVAFISDSIAVVGNPALNTVTPVNVLRGTRGEDIPVGEYPHAIVAVNDTAYVLNARLGPDFQPVGPGTVSVIAGSPAAVIETIQLTGANPGAAAVGTDVVYILHSGHFGADDGSLSTVHRGSLTESSHEPGFGDFPGGIARAPDGRLVIAAFSYGLAVWNPATATFSRPPEAPITPGGASAIAGVGFDSAGRLYALEPECVGPGSALRLNASFDVDLTIEVGICPVAITFTELSS